MKESKKPDILSILPPEYREQVRSYVNTRVRQAVLKEKRNSSEGNQKKLMEAEGCKNIRHATEIAAQMFGANMVDLLSPSRLRAHTDARMFVYYWATTSTQMTITSIGKWFNRDHATVIHGAKRIKDLLEVDKNFAHLYNQFINKLTGKQYEVSNISQRAADYTSGKVDLLVHRVND